VTRSPPFASVALSALVAGGLVVASVISFMPNTVTVTTAVANATPPSSAAPDGAVLFRAKGCSSCHGSTEEDSRSRSAPSLFRLADRAGSRVEGLDAEQYVRASILTPQAYLAAGSGGLTMPTLPVDDAELDALVAYLLRQ